MKLQSKLLFGMVAASLFSTVYAVELGDLDADADGAVSQEEAADNQMLIDHWAEVDTDGDGSISAEEFEAAVANEELAKAAGLME